MGEGLGVLCGIVSLSAGKEYVCVLRLHDAIASEAKLAQVSQAGEEGKGWGRECPSDDLVV